MIFGGKKKTTGKLADAVPTLGAAKPNGAATPNHTVPGQSASAGWTGAYDAAPTAAPSAAAAPAAPSATASRPTPKPMTPEMLRDPAVQKQLTDVRTKLQAAIGQIVLAMANLPRYRNQMMGDVQTLVLDPLMRDRIAIASEKAENGDAAQSLAGIAFWATVSPEVDTRIREQIKTGSFPVRLKQADWTSGDIVWLLDVIAPSQKLATDVLLSFRKVAKGASDVRIHPVVARQIDPELLKRLTGAVTTSSAQT